MNAGTQPPLTAAQQAVIGPPPTPWWKDNENQKDIATALGVAMELFNAYQPMMKPGVALGMGILLRAGLNFFGGKP